MSIRYCTPSEEHPEGHYEVHVSVWKGSHRQKTVDVAMNGGKRKAGRVAEDVERDLREELLRLRNQSVHSAGSLTAPIKTFKDILELWRRTDFTKGPRRGQQRILDKGAQTRYDRLIEELGDRKPWDVEPSLRELAARWLEDEDFEPATINHHIVIAKSAMDYAADTVVGEGRSARGLIERNYLKRFQLLAVNNVKYRILSDAEELKLWGHLSARLRPLYFLAVLVPMRVSELVNLRWEGGLNQFSGCITLTRTKNGFARTVKIPDAYRPIIDAMDKSRSEYVFSDDRGDPLGYWSDREQRVVFNRYGDFEYACKTAKIEGYNFHKTRQKAAMSFYQQTKDEKLTMMVGGWKSDGAFYRYFNRELASQIAAGTFTISTAFVDTFREDLVVALKRKVA